MLKPPILIDFRTYLPWSAVVAGVGLAGLAAVVLAVVRWPVLVHVYALLAAAVLLAAWVRGRATYGRRRRWPPGSLAIGASFDAIGDRDYYRDQARIHGPVFKTSQFGRPVVCVVGLELARDILRGDAVVGASLPYDRFLPKGTLRYMDTRTHDAEAPFFRAALAGLDLEQHEDRARNTCNEMLRRLSAASCSSPNGARPREDLRKWAFTILASAFWGMAPDDPRLPALDEAQQGLQVGRGGGPRWRRTMLRSLGEINRLLRDQHRQWSTTGTGTGEASVLGAVLSADVDALDDPSRAHNLALIFRLALTDVTSLLCWILAHLTDHSEWQSAVRDARGNEGSGAEPEGDIASHVVHETLRLEQSEYLYREVARPFEIGRFLVPQGWLLRVCVQESHRDPAIFPDPDRFDPDRFAGRPRSRREYSPFGADDHGCMGVPIVHFLGRIFVEELCQGYEAVVTRDAPLDRGTRHRDHWRPGAARRVRLTPLTGADG